MEKTITKEFSLQLVEDFDDEAFAAVAKNKAFNYLKFILTDDQPNANKQLVPLEEFENLIQSGYFTPIKMALKRIEDGHEESFPLGVITHLKQENNLIKGIAALWSRERPEDVELVKDAYAKKIPLNVSWEIMYADSEMTDEGIEVLKGTSLRAATIVGLPAYQGRTPIYAVASKNQEDKNLDELELTKQQLTDANSKLGEVQTSLDETLKKVAELEGEIAPLKEFKASADADKEKAEKLTSIRKKFADAGLQKEDEYFSTNEELLLNLSEPSLDFMIQELVSFSSKEEKASSKKEIPNLKADPDEKDITALVGALRQRLQKK